MTYSEIREQLQQEYDFEKFVPLAQRVGFWYLAKKGFWALPMDPVPSHFQYNEKFVTRGHNYHYTEHDIEEMVQSTIVRWFEKEEWILNTINRIRDVTMEECIRYFIGMLRNSIYDLYNDQKRRNKYEERYTEKYYPRLTEDFTELIHLKLSIKHTKKDEEEIIRLIQHGYNVSEIAARINKSKSTIRRKLQEIKVKSEHLKPPKKKPLWKFVEVHEEPLQEINQTIVSVGPIDTIGTIGPVVSTARKKKKRKKR